MNNEAPKLGEERILETMSKNGKPFYVIERFDDCNCPVCEESGHWMRMAGGPDLQAAKSFAALANIATVVQ